MARKKKEQGEQAPATAAAAAEKKVPGVLRRYVAPNRVEEREAQGWKRVQEKGAVLRGGSVLMEKAS